MHITPSFALQSDPPYGVPMQLGVAPCRDSPGTGAFTLETIDETGVGQGHISRISSRLGPFTWTSPRLRGECVTRSPISFQGKFPYAHSESGIEGRISQLQKQTRPTLVLATGGRFNSE